MYIVTLKNGIRVGYKFVYKLMVSAYIQSSIVETSENDVNNELEKACDNTDHLHPLFMYLKQESLHRQNVIEEMIQSCNISSVNLYTGAKEVNTIAHTCTTHTTTLHSSYITICTHTPTHISLHTHIHIYR